MHRSSLRSLSLLAELGMFVAILGVVTTVGLASLHLVVDLAEALARPVLERLGSLR
ncbi:MAG: hypothetical protein JNK15_25900 [Planctomycetes bacterium]|nr:hypothetical protein [Planctomycetota bacterium]